MYIAKHIGLAVQSIEEADDIGIMDVSIDECRSMIHANTP
jgi:hypothetical protein